MTVTPRSWLEITIRATGRAPASTPSIRASIISTRRGRRDITSTPPTIATGQPLQEGGSSLTLTVQASQAGQDGGEPRVVQHGEVRGSGPQEETEGAVGASAPAYCR